jgi:hypothetical protein
MALTQVASGLIASVSGASLTGTQNIPKATLPTGSVLQVVNYQYSPWTTTTSTSFVATSLATSITPVSTSNKVLVSVTIASAYTASSVSAVRLRLYKNGSFLAYLDDDLLFGLGGGSAGGAYTCLDSPATTSSTTYTVWFASASGATVGINNYYSSNNTSSSSINLMEISA